MTRPETSEMRSRNLRLLWFRLRPEFVKLSTRASSRGAKSPKFASCYFQPHQKKRTSDKGSNHDDRDLSGREEGSCRGIAENEISGTDKKGSRNQDPMIGPGD